jgi:hypothetical protein
VAELLREWMRYNKVYQLQDQAAVRRIHDIINGKTQIVTLQAFDRICMAVDHQEWMELISPI